MILFYVHHLDRDSYDLGLFVSASTRAEAINLWRDWVTSSFPERDPMHPKTVFVVPKLADVPTQHTWHTTTGVMSVEDTTEFDELDVIAHALNYGITSYKQVTNTRQGD